MSEANVRKHAKNGRSEATKGQQKGFDLPCVPDTVFVLRIGKRQIQQLVCARIASDRRQSGLGGFRRRIWVLALHGVFQHSQLVGSKRTRGHGGYFGNNDKD